MDVLSYMVEEILDPTNIIEGKRFEVTLELNIDEEDELFQEGGVDLRAIIADKEDALSIVSYFLIAKANGEYLEFALEDEELEEILAFCKETVFVEQ